MKKHDCKTVRGEIDEANLDAPLSLKASDHLSVCEECRRFHDDWRTLRGLIGNLETVAAPADFDFRLRARLTRERHRNGFASLMLTARPIAAVAVIIVIAMVALVVKSRLSSTVIVTTIDTKGSQPASSIPQIGLQREPDRVEIPKSLEQKTNRRENLVKVAVVRQRKENARNTPGPVAKNSLAANGIALRTRESAGRGADVVTPELVGALVQVPVDSRVFKVSIDNGHGRARTISLPSVSFGSQPLIARDASFIPVSSSRGDW